MIEDFARLIPSALLDQSGAVFYSGRQAFSGRSDIYVLGLNPGGDCEAVSETVHNHTVKVLERLPADWSSYVDEAWLSAPGESPLQKRVCHLLGQIGADPRRVPASNLIFARSRSAQDLRGRFDTLADLCWPFHAAVMQRLGCRIVLCFGNDAAGAVRARVGAHSLMASYEEQNFRRLTSAAYRNRDGLVVIRLTHPGRFNWCNPNSDPSNLVGRVQATMRELA